MTTPHSMSWAVLRDVLQRSRSWPARLRARSANSRYGAPGAKPRYTGVVTAAGFLAGVAWARPVAGASSATSPTGIKRMAQYKDPKRNRPGVLSPGPVSAAIGVVQTLRTKQARGEHPGP